MVRRAREDEKQKKEATARWWCSWFLLIFHTTRGRERNDKRDTWCNVKSHSILANHTVSWRGTVTETWSKFLLSCPIMYWLIIDRHVRLFPLRGLCSGCWQLYRTLCGTLGKQADVSFTKTRAKVFPTCNTIISLPCQQDISLFSKDERKKKRQKVDLDGWKAVLWCFLFLDISWPSTLHLDPCGTWKLTSGVWCRWMGCSRG